MLFQVADIDYQCPRLVILIPDTSGHCLLLLHSVMRKLKMQICEMFINVHK
jgi:hypothetical protein